MSRAGAWIAGHSAVCVCSNSIQGSNAHWSKSVLLIYLGKSCYEQAGDGIPDELFKILKDDAVRMLHLICQHIGKTQQQSQDWKTSVLISNPNKSNAKECSK